MKIVVLGDKTSYRNALPDNPWLDSDDCIFVGRDATDDEVVATCPDAEIILFDAIARIDAELIERLPQLKLLNSEGVGFNGVDVEAATKRGIYVCNNHGGNAGAVAEQTILLMLGLLRNAIEWDKGVREGHQMDIKMHALRSGCITDLADCTVGLIGMGSIAQAVALRLNAFGARVLYTSRHRRPENLEEQLHIEYARLEDLLSASDIVSVHIPPTSQTAGMVNAEFLAQMKPTAYLINTSRGELMDNAAVAHALEAGTIAGAGLDTIAPEPVDLDNPLLKLSPAAAQRVVYSPHIGGITAGSMRRMQQHMWNNVELVARGERPDGIVNGL